MSKEQKYRANASEINKTPNQIRYVFIVEEKGSYGAPTIGTTYQTLSRVDGKVLEKIIAVDIIKDKLIVWKNPTQGFYSKLMYEWRENYFNPDWDVSTI